MGKFLIVLACICLSGCFFGSHPLFHDEAHGISFNNPANLLIKSEDNTAIPSKKWILAKKSFFDLEVTLSKKGFEDKKIKLKSHFTDDKWAETQWSVLDVYRPSSPLFLLPPTETIGWTGTGAILGFAGGYDTGSWILAPFGAVIGAAGGLIFGVGRDIWNLVTLAFPRAVFGNPWYEYDRSVDLSKEILIPTPEFKKQCHSQKNTFIGNHKCLSCQIIDDSVATKEECDRCPDREWEDNLCNLKENKKYMLP